VALVGATLLTLATPVPSLLAHEVPTRVSVVTIVRPTGQRLQILVRAPLGAMRDMEFPLKGAGYLDLDRAQPLYAEAARLWLADYLDVFENGRELGAERVVAARVSLPSDRSFGAYHSARDALNAPPLPGETEVPWQQLNLDVLFEYDIASDQSRFAIEPRFAHLGVQTSTLVRFYPAAGGERVLQFPGDPGLIHLSPGWWQAASRFMALGFEHILDGVDHLLFLLCLVIPVRRLRPLVGIVTAFTAAHSITLIAAAFGMAPDALWFPPLIETLIAASIVFMAFENILGARIERRWMLAFGFGLVHGFGFSFALRESLQFAGSHLLSALLSFNVGVEIGQLLMVAVALPVLAFAFRRLVPERVGSILLSALVAHTAWHWMTERGSTLREYDWSMPAFDAGLLVSLMRAAMLGLIVAVAGWGMRALATHLSDAAPRTGPEAR
jgi:hypothetical protein